MTTVYDDCCASKFCLKLLFHVVAEGFETARALALHGAHVVLACRNMRSANSAVNAIKTENVAADVDAMFLDLTSLKTVQNFAYSYISRNVYASYCSHCLTFTKRTHGTSSMSVMLLLISVCRITFLELLQVRPGYPKAKFSELFTCIIGHSCQLEVFCQFLSRILNEIY